MEKRCIASENGPPVAGPYTPAVAVGDLLFCSGVICLKPDGSGVANESLESEVRQCLANLKAVLGDAGSALERVAKMTVYLDDMNDFAELNEIYAEYFPTNPPARTCIEVAKLPLGVRVEMEAIAILA